MERDLLKQIWPVFSAEAREHLQGIGAGVLELEREPSQPAVLDGLRRTAHSLKGSAGSLGLADVETLAHAIEGSLAGFDPAEGLARAAVQAALDAVEAMEAAIAAGDAGGEVRVPALGGLVAALGAVPGASLPPSARAAAQVPAAAEAGAAPIRPPPPAAGLEAPPQMAALEASIERLCAPLDPEERRRIAAEGAHAAREIAEGRRGEIASSARQIGEAFAALAAGGPEAPRATAALAGDLIDLRDALEGHPRGGPSPAHRAGANGAAGGAQPAAPADKSIRVLASTLDSLARQLELLTFAEARHARRARDLLAAEGTLRDVARTLDEALGAMRAAGVEAGRDPIQHGRERLRALASDVARLGREGVREAEGQRLAGAVLREDLRNLRMVPAALVLEPLRRAVRDVAGKLEKDVELVLEGADVRLDRRVIDELRDPLLHLVRNAVDHGIELPAARTAAGKPARGRVTVRVEPRGTRVGVVVEDDGRGLDLPAIRAEAVKRGVIGADAAPRMGEEESVRLLFHAGFSTRKQVTEVSGRGVGLDVVQDSVRKLQGSVDVSFERGRGARFTLEVPLTLAATAALLFRIGRDVAALPAEAVERVLLFQESDLGTVAGRATVKVGEEQLPFAPLGRLLGVPAPEAPSRRRTALVLHAGTQRVAVGVEEVLGQQELVIAPLGARVAAVSHLAGASVLDDGRVVGMLAAPEVVRRAQPAAGGARATARAKIVVADDSLTTRSAMKALLEIAGYAVLAAADGEEALQLLRESGASLVVSDVQMPRLDGLGLTRRVKGDPGLRQTPVILITSLDAPEDRAAGLEAGADGYLVKREVQRGKLLELVRQLLPARA